MDQAIEQLVDAWGSLGSLFGFNPSTSRVSALLIVTGETLSLGEIAERLQISRGNASMCLRELRTWDVVEPVTKPGDRRSYYRSSSDLWRMFLTIARERKRREFDPAFARALDALAAAPDALSETRIQEIEEFLRTLDQIGRSVLENQAAGLSLITVLRSGLTEPEE